MSIVEPRFCPMCGSELLLERFDGDERKYCSECDFHIFHLPCPSAGVAVVDESKILLIRRGNQPYSGTWSLPGGVVEHGESPREAAVRELREETAITASPSNLVLCDSRGWDSGPDIQYDITTVSILFATSRADTTGKPKSGPDTVDARYWTLDEIRHKLRPGEEARIRKAIRTVNE